MLLVAVALPGVVVAGSCASGVLGYLTGTGHFKDVGLPGEDSFNLDRRYRVYSTTSGCRVTGMEILTHAPNNLAIALMTTLFGPMPGTYRGPYPDREQAREALRLSEEVVRVDALEEEALAYLGERGPVRDCSALRKLFPPSEGYPVARCALFEQGTLVVGYMDRAVLRDRETGSVYASYRLGFRAAVNCECMPRLPVAAGVRAAGPSGDLPLLRVVQSPAPEDAILATVGEFINGGADVDADDGNGRTPLFLAAERGLVAVVRRLLEAGADPNRRWALDRTTPLMAAAASESPRAVAVAELLLKAGAQIDAESCGSGTALSVVAAFAPNSAHRLRLAPRTALSVAAWTGHLEMVRFLLEAGSRVTDDDLTSLEVTGDPRVSALLRNSARPG